MTPSIIKSVVRNNRVSGLKPVALKCCDLVGQDSNPLANGLVTSLHSFTNKVIKDSICYQGFGCINAFMRVSRFHDENTKVVAKIARQTRIAALTYLGIRKQAPVRIAVSSVTKLCFYTVRKWGMIGKSCPGYIEN